MAEISLISGSNPKSTHLARPQVQRGRRAERRRPARPLREARLLRLRDLLARLPAGAAARRRAGREGARRGGAGRRLGEGARHEAGVPGVQGGDGEEGHGRLLRRPEDESGD